jgi:ParB/Sulfiredoxin domain
MPNVIALPLALLLLESSIQPREGVTASTVNEYAALYTDGHELAPIMVYQEGSEYWVADGFHRVAAAQQAGLSGIAAEVRQGTKRDALLYAAGANKHGKPMSNEDKRRVVMNWSAACVRHLQRMQVSQHSPSGYTATATASSAPWIRPI